MARIKINPSTDIKTLKRELKKRGYVLRVYHPPDGSTRYVVHRQIYKMIATIATALVTCAAIALGLTSCNVTRTITTQSQYYQKGDTTCTIVTKTIETYDATKKLY